MNQGDVYWYTFKDRDKRRPVVILTRNSAIAFLSSLTVAPITSTIRGIPTEVVLSQADGLLTDCAMSLDNIQTVQKSKLGAFIAHLSGTRMQEVRKAIEFALGFDALVAGRRSGWKDGKTEESMLILGVETSCDETAAAVVEDGWRICSDVVASQIAVHSPYGGVVPELASRKHVEAILPVIAQALDEAGMTARELDAIAVTQGPGLVGALLVGLSAAKALAFALDRPLLAVNHLEGHMHAAFLGREPLGVPFVCLVVSGGHTALYLVEPDGQSNFLGSTRDDAAGEAFDKVAKLLDLGYPGGVVIDRLAAQGNPLAFQFPKAYLEQGSLEFSFSGIKTAVATFLRRNGAPAKQGETGPYRLEDLAASFQEAVVEVLVNKTLTAAELCGVKEVAVVGGVAANSRLRRRLHEETAVHRFNLHLPPLRFCTDNAVMIAAAAYSSWKRSGFCQEPLDVDAFSRWF